MMPDFLPNGITVVSFSCQHDSLESESSERKVSMEELPSSALSGQSFGGQAYYSLVQEDPASPLVGDSFLLSWAT